MGSATILLCLSAGSLMALGMVMLYSAAMVQKGAHYMMMQAMWGGLGLIACAFMANVDYRRWRNKKIWKNFSVYAFVIAVGLVISVLLIGAVRNYSRRWLVYGPFSFQPSEAAKLALILFLAWYVEHYQRFMGTFWRGIAIPLGCTGLLLVPIFVEPDRGTTILLGLLACVMLVMGGARWWHIGLPALCGVLFLAHSLSNDAMRTDRIKAWLNPEKYQTTIAYQQWQSILAIGHGGTEGLGLGNGRGKMGFLPENQTDFIYSVVAEELGFYASLGVVVAFAIFLLCGMYIAWHAENLFGFLIASGITLLVGLQSFINMGVVTNLIPNKGMALPFMSYGGSNLLMTLTMVGLLLSVAWHRETRSLELEADDLIDPEMTAEKA